MGRLYLRAGENIHKRVLIQAAACNLALLLRSLHGAGKPRAAHDLKSVTNLAFLRLTISIFGMGWVDLASPRYRARTPTIARSMVREPAVSQKEPI